MINKERLAEVKFVNNSGQEEPGGEKQPKERNYFGNQKWIPIKIQMEISFTP